MTDRQVTRRVIHGYRSTPFLAFPASKDITGFFHARIFRTLFISETGHPLLLILPNSDSVKEEVTVFFRLLFFIYSSIDVVRGNTWFITCDYWCGRDVKKKK